ncbi:MAG: cache domain-containing protein [Desulfovibrionaceae bacterium]
MGALWIVYGITTSERDIEMLHAQYLQINKELVADQTRQAVAAIHDLSASTEDVLKETIRENVVRAHAIAWGIWKNSPGVPPRELAERIRTALRPIRFSNGRGGLFIFDKTGATRLCSSMPEHEGKAFWDTSDSAGRLVLQNMRTIGDRDGEGFHHYLWPKPDAPGIESPKIAFIKRFDPLGWYIGAGEYVEDVTRDMQAKAIARVESMTFGEDGYVFVGTWDGVSLTRPAKGKSMLQTTDLNGVKVVQELIRTAQNGGGFVTYLMPPLNGLTPHAKVSYTEAFSEWKWYVGAGFSMANIENVVATRKTLLHRMVIRHSIYVCLLIALLLAASIAYSHYTANKLNAGIATFRRFFIEAATANVRLDDHQVMYAEFTPMAEAANRMLDDRIAAQEALATSERRARVLFENAYQIAAVLDPQGTLLDVNNTALEASGATKRDMRGRLFWNTPWWGVSAEEKELLRQAVSAASHGVTTRLEVGHTAQDGSMRTVDFSLKPIQDENQDVTLLIAEGRDITDSRKAAAALEEREARLDAIFRTAPVGIGLMSGKRLVQANDRLCDITGYDLEALTALPSHSLYADAAHYAHAMAQLNIQLARRGTGSLETRWRHRSGAVRDVLINMTAISQPEPHGWAVITVMDITQRTHTEQELHRLQSLLQDIVNSMPSLLAAVDTQGHILQWNLEAERHSGIATAAAMGKPLATVFPALAAKLDVRAAVNETAPLTMHRVAWDISEEQRYADITIYPLGEVGGAVIRVDNATERVRLEEVMVRAEKMLSLGGLAAGMAHEINNPLAGMMQGAQVMSLRLSPAVKKNQEAAARCATSMDAIAAYAAERGFDRILDGMMDSGRRASRIIANMLGFSRKDNAEMAKHSIQVLLDQAVELATNDYDLKKRYDFRRINIIRNYTPNIPAVRCDSGKIQQVFLNILKNGAQAMAVGDHTPAGAGPAPERPLFNLHVRLEGGMVRVDIQDNGPGMPDHVRKRIFEPFFTTKPVGQGTGLGLSVSYCIVTENHGGTITVDSAPDKGTTFSILLPVQGATAATT